MRLLRPVPLALLGYRARNDGEKWDSPNQQIRSAILTFLAILTFCKQRGLGMKKGWNKAFKRIVAKADREVKEFERSWDATLQRLADEWNKVADARDKEGR